jgi:hypothetical protein
MKPIAGVYMGSVFMHGSKKSYLITIRLQVDERGPLTGSFVVEGEGWSGPTRGEFDGGGWSPYGTLHLAEEQDVSNKGKATFDGFYAGTDTSSAAIWGRIFVTKERDSMKVVTQTGTLQVAYVVVEKFVNGEGPWGN